MVNYKVIFGDRKADVDKGVEVDANSVQDALKTLSNEGKLEGSVGYIKNTRNRRVWKFDLEETVHVNLRKLAKDKRLAKEPEAVVMKERRKANAPSFVRDDFMLKLNGNTVPIHLLLNSDYPVLSETDFVAYVYENIAETIKFDHMKPIRFGKFFIIGKLNDREDLEIRTATRGKKHVKFESTSHVMEYKDKTLYATAYFNPEYPVLATKHFISAIAMNCTQKEGEVKVDFGKYGFYDFVFEEAIVPEEETEEIEELSEDEENEEIKEMENSAEE